MEPVERTCRSAAAGRTAVRRKFGGYKPEKPKIVRTAEVHEPEAVKVFRDAWERYRTPTWISTIPGSFRMACDLVGDFKASAHDVGLMMVAATDLKAGRGTDYANKVGLLITAFINKGSDSTYELSTHHLPVPPRELGRQNTKNLVIRGNNLDAVGTYMESGTIIVYGNTSNNTGAGMGGGTILVVGDVTDHAGLNMENGKIVVMGGFGKSLGSGMKGGSITAYGGPKTPLDDGEYVGIHSTGGEIYIYGHYPYSFELSKPRGGKIYYQGRLIVDK